jgi:outer membrane receptor protein involved in Fe transport
LSVINYFFEGDSMKRLTSIATFLVMLLMVGVAAFGQTSNGTLTGTVRDSAGAVVTDAQIKITSEATGEVRNATTTGDGGFRVDALQPGRYSVHVEKSGFKGFELQHLQVSPSVITSYDVPLTVAGATTELTVQTANTATLDIESGEIASTIGSQELESVPIFSNNPVELVQTLPGVQLVNNGGLSNGINVSIDGGRPRANNYLIDGQDDNDNGISGQALQANVPDMYSNVVALTNSFSAEYGRGGAGVVNLITKSGTNKFHGTVYDLYSGSGLNALDGTNRGVPFATKARFDQHQMGFTVGGPIIKDKLFGFGGAQYTRFYGQATPSLIHLPDAAGVAQLQAIGTPNALLLLNYIGSLSQYIPETGSATTVALINEPNCASCSIKFAPYRRPNQPQQNPDTQWTYKVDWLATHKDTFAVRYLHDRTSLTPDFFNFSSQLPGFDSEQGGPAEQGAGIYTHVFSPKVINEFRVSETRINFAFASTPATLANPLYSLPPISIANTSLPTLGPASTSLPQGRGHSIYQFQDTVSFTVGRQTIRVGADIGRDIIRDFIPFNLNGSLSFTKSAASISLGLPSYTALNNFLDNDLGTGGSAAKSFGSPRVDAHEWQTAYFVQDDVKLTSDLTINLGLRYEYQTNPENAVQYPAINAATALTDPINALYKVAEDRNNFAPRVGFAYNPHGGMALLADGKTVYHGGFGIFYDVIFTNITDNSQSLSPNDVGGNIIVTTGRGAANATSLVPSISAALSPLNSTELTTNNLVNPQTFQWNVGFERQLPGQVKFTANYVASRSEKLLANQQYNYFNPATGLRLNPARGAIVARGNFADSEYQSVQMEVSHDFRHGFFIRGAYTYGKNLDDGSEVFTLFSSPTSYTANLAPGARRQDWGPSAYDFRQDLSISYAYNIPGVHFQDKFADGFADVVARGWQFSGVTYYQSGPYSTFNLNGLDLNGDGSAANDRPLIGNPHAPFESAGVDGALVGGVAGTYYDLGQNDTNGTNVPVQPSQVHFLIPYPYTPAQMTMEVGRNSFRNPGFYRFDFAAQKSIALPFKHFENSALVLRADAQNVFNHNNVGVLDTNLFDMNVPGTVGNSFLDKPSARFDDNRIVRLWAKYVF